MKRLAWWLLLAPALHAQVVLTAGDDSVSLAQVLRPHSEGVILTVPDAQGHSLLAALQAAAGQDPALPLLLEVQELSPRQACGKELMALSGWSGDHPHWALVGPDRRVYAEGAEAPGPAALAEAYGRSPLHARINALREFLRTDAGQGEAQAQLLLALRDLAERRAEQVKGEAPLSEADDARIWDEYAGRYETFFKTELWKDADPGVSSPVPNAAKLSVMAARSPRLQALAEQLMPEVESALRAKPSDPSRWALWRSFRDAGAKGQASAVLAGLDPLPGTRRWPPEAAVEAFVEDARARGDWRDAEPVLQASFDQNEDLLRRLQAAAQEDAGRGGKVDLGAAFGFGQWNGDTAALVEAKLRLGKLDEADRIFQRVYGRAPRLEFAQAAAQLARDCNAEALAEKWAEMGNRR
jgi:hypothetical protein